MISIIAFSGNASLHVSVESAYVVYWGQIVSTIKTHRTEIIDEEQVQQIVSLCNQKSQQEIAGKHIHKESGIWLQITRIPLR